MIQPQVKRYDLIALSSGSPFRIVKKFIAEEPNATIAVIDKDPMGGICLTRGCVPTKLMLYPAQLIRETQDYKRLGLIGKPPEPNFSHIMERMRSYVQKRVKDKQNFFKEHGNVDYYSGLAEFVDETTLKINDRRIYSEKIILCLGSEPFVPDIGGMNDINYHTNKTVVNMRKLPRSIVFVGGGFIAIEFGHFFAAMGSKVTIIEYNDRILGPAEPEISHVAHMELKKHLNIVLNHQVSELKKRDDGVIEVIAKSRNSEEKMVFETQEVFMATGRKSNASLIHPERAGIKLTEKGWIVVDQFMETTHPNIWAFGDCTGKFLFKHMALYEMDAVYANAIKGKKTKVEYPGIPYASFTYPEIGSVGLTESHAIDQVGKEEISIGYFKYGDSVKGFAMGLEERNYFVKTIVEKKTNKLLGAHIVGPHASILIQELVNLLYAPSRKIDCITQSIYVHPALQEVIELSLQHQYSWKEYQRIKRDILRS